MFTREIQNIRESHDPDRSLKLPEISLTRLILNIFVLLIMLYKIIKTENYKGCTKSKTLRLKYLQFSSNRPTAQSQHFIITSPLDQCPIAFPNSVVII